MTKLKKLYLGIILLWLVLISISVYAELAERRTSQKNVHLKTGQAVFDLLVTTRAWNASHGGVYVPITDEVQPNEYLVDPQRDVETLDGLLLTKINPAYMTRLIGELADQRDDVSFHITSLNPIRPENKADDWEKTALMFFEREGGEEYFDYYEYEEKIYFRYMAPLNTEENCLFCHAKQGYRLGDVRGGIRVTFPVAFSINWMLILTHLFIAFSGSGIIFFLGIKLEKTMNSLENQTRLDELTQIHNRRYFDEIYKREFLLAKRRKEFLSIALCDLDCFKAYNDTYGHLAGDECLRKVAQAIKKVLKRPGDSVARYGGEEFGVIMSYTPVEGALTVSNMICKEVEMMKIPHKNNLASEYVTVSVGVSSSTCQEESETELLLLADHALYQAKENGRNTVVCQGEK
jgi:diguanylate cyclase (GGDEF)-like protein